MTQAGPDTELLGIEPYFVCEIEGKPAYIEFRIGDYEHELGFIDSRFAPAGADQHYLEILESRQGL